jgi:gliding motility-associated lipoprotein GldB
MNKFLSIIIVAASFTLSCKTDSKLEYEISKIDTDITIERFDQLFADAKPNDLPQLKKAYPFMFSKRYNDSVWINRINDTLQKQLNVEVNKIHGNFKQTKEEIQGLFRHLKYYYKTFKTPRVITVISDVDYRNKVIVTDSMTLIALDTYLGANHFFYYDIYEYIKQNMKPSQIVPDLAMQYAQQYISQPRRKTLLDEMIYFGKTLYFKDVMLPNISDQEKIGYTRVQLDWAQENESNIWRHFVEKELLFSTDSKLASRFINPSPFSKFNLELDGESPGRLGQYIGWQIVKAYAKNNDTSLLDILNMNAEDIFNNSKFKPRK